MLEMIKESFEIKTDIEKDLNDQKILLKLHQEDWSCDISNNGHMLAFYDKAQIARYKSAKDMINKEKLHVYEEKLHVYNVFSKKAD